MHEYPSASVKSPRETKVVERGVAPEGAAPAVRGYPSTLLRVNRSGRGLSPIYVKLQNKANFPRCWTLWIGLRDK